MKIPPITFVFFFLHDRSDSFLALVKTETKCSQTHGRPCIYYPHAILYDELHYGK